MPDDTISRAKKEFTEAVLKSVDGLNRTAAEQRIASIVSDVWNGLEATVRCMPVKVRDKKGI